MAGWQSGRCRCTPLWAAPGQMESNGSSRGKTTAGSCEKQLPPDEEDDRGRRQQDRGDHAAAAALTCVILHGLLSHGTLRHPPARLGNLLSSMACKFSVL